MSTPRPRDLRRFWVLTVVLSRVARANAGRRLSLLWTVVLLFASVIFGPEGLTTREVTAGARANLAFGVVLWTVWLLLSAPVAAAALDQGRVLVLRALPVPGWWFWVVRGGHLLVLELPWALLWGRGQGLGAGLAAAVVAAAAHAAIVAAWARRVGARPARAVAAPARRSLIPARAAPALAVAAGLAAGRANRGSLGRALVITLFGAGIAALAAVNNEVAQPATLATLAAAVACTPVVLVTAGAAGQVLSFERRVTWLLDACGTSRPVRARAAAAVVAGWGASCGAAQALGVAVVAAPSAAAALRIVLAGAVAGAVLGCAVLAGVRVADAASGERAELLLFALPIATAVASTVVIGLLGELAVVLGALGAAAAWPRAGRAPRPGGSAP